MRAGHNAARGGDAAGLGALPAPPLPLAQEKRPAAVVWLAEVAAAGAAGVVSVAVAGASHRLQPGLGARAAAARAPAAAARADGRGSRGGVAPGQAGRAARSARPGDPRNAVLDGDAAQRAVRAGAL